MINDSKFVAGGTMSPLVAESEGGTETCVIGKSSGAEEAKGACGKGDKIGGENTFWSCSGIASTAMG